MRFRHANTHTDKLLPFLIDAQSTDYKNDHQTRMKVHRFITGGVLENDMENGD